VKVRLDSKDQEAAEMAAREQLAASSGSAPRSVSFQLDWDYEGFAPDGPRSA